METASAPRRSTIERDLGAGLRDRVRSIDRTAWIEALKAVVITRIALIAIAYAASWFLSPDTTGPPTTGFLDMWTRWDARHFVQVAQFGYTDPRTDPHAPAFFPLLPLLIRAISSIGIAPQLAGMLVSFGATVVAAAYLYRLGESELGEGLGRRAMLYLLLWPTSVFLIAGYSEALFLAGAIAAFYYARSERWHLVGIPAAIAMGARFAGVFLLIGLLVEFLRQRDFSKTRVVQAGLAMTIGLLPLLVYFAYMSQATGNAFAYVAAQKDGWGRTFVGPVSAFKTTWNTWYGDYTTNWLFAWRMEIFAALVGLVFTIWAFVKKEWGYGAFMAATLAVLMTSTWYYSIPRMLLSFFPAMLLLAALSKDSSRAHENTLLVLAPLCALGVIVFTRGLWFF